MLEKIGLIRYNVGEDIMLILIFKDSNFSLKNIQKTRNLLLYLDFY